MIRLEVMNRVCPKCGNGNWMRRIVGDKSDDIGRLNVKCLNCLSYFNEDDLSGVVKQYTGIKTNADRIRAMSDEELTRFLAETSRCSDWCNLYEKCKTKTDRSYSVCLETWNDWLKQKCDS